MESKKSLPHFCSGLVIKGFGRGSKELGIPTANFPENVIDTLPDDISTGVYFGYGAVDSGPVYKMVMSIGWNPYYQNEKKSMETHILHEFEQDFYGKNLKVAILGFIRPEENFGSLEELISTIKNDIAVADEKLNEPEYLKYKLHDFFKENETE